MLFCAPVLFWASHEAKGHDIGNQRSKHRLLTSIHDKLRNARATTPEWVGPDHPLCAPALFWVSHEAKGHDIGNQRSEHRLLTNIPDKLRNARATAPELFSDLQANICARHLNLDTARTSDLSQLCQRKPILKKEHYSKAVHSKPHYHNFPPHSEVRFTIPHKFNPAFANLPCCTWSRFSSEHIPGQSHKCHAEQ